MPLLLCHCAAVSCPCAAGNCCAVCWQYVVLVVTRSSPGLGGLRRCLLAVSCHGAVFDVVPSPYRLDSFRSCEMVSVIVSPTDIAKVTGPALSQPVATVAPTMMDIDLGVLS